MSGKTAHLAAMEVEVCDIRFYRNIRQVCQEEEVLVARGDGDIMKRDFWY